MTDDSKHTISREWEGWMESSRKSDFQGLRDFVRSRTLESDVVAYLADGVLMSQKVDLLEINKEQLARNDRAAG